MAKFIIKYTQESWREVYVEATDEDEARQNFLSNESVYWETDREYDAFLDYDTFDVYATEEEA